MISELMVQFCVQFVNFHVEKSASIFRNTQGGRLWCLAVRAFVSRQQSLGFFEALENEDQVHNHGGP